MVLHKDTVRAYVLVECKPSSFGSGSAWAPQARGLIVAGGNVGSRLGLSGAASAEVCYLVPATEADATDGTLVALDGEVAGEGLRGCPTAAIGVSIQSDGIYLRAASQPQGQAQVQQHLSPAQRVLTLADGEAPRPLYIIPWIPDAPDSTDLAALREKMRSELQARLGKAPVASKLVVEFDDLLDAVTRGVFSSWRDRDSLKGRVYPTLGGLVQAFFDDDSRVQVGRSRASFAINTATDQAALMERLRTADVPDRLAEGVQLHMDIER